MEFVEVRDLVKKFGEFAAVNDISFNVKRGEIFGILGPNGAGKTTTLNIMIGLLKATSGSVFINGLDISRHGTELKQLIGLMTQETVVEADLTARQNLELFAKLYHLSKSETDERVAEALKEAQLTEFADKKAGTFSGGMQRRLLLVKTLIHEPKLLILDEPTTGLDIQNRAQMWSHIRHLHSLGITTILTTQYLEEADALCDRLAIIDHGKIIAMGTNSEIKRIVGENILEVVTEEKFAQKVSVIVKEVSGVAPEIKADKVTANIKKDPLGTIRRISDALNKNKIPVLAISMHLPTLDDVFMKLTGSTIRDETGEMKNSRAQMRFR
ncbi:MAG: ATP-binding cassette domain-containing protein [Candidatus Marsarchaeota archaeon]|jgi:ABC-2 type transport system ATP-binding protein|nr:ATP-binding cassette domain-containing protein [Candidatus Marsarchaeota archaeon]MCL5419128.1 ATP-binding cassette domain-containing protein [Candidatus Marsarchaeota archaeon]